MPQNDSSRPQPRHWIKFLDPWMQVFYPVLGWGLAAAYGEHSSSQHPHWDKKSVSHLLQQTHHNLTSSSCSHWLYDVRLTHTHTELNRSHCHPFMAWRAWSCSLWEEELQNVKGAIALPASKAQLSPQLRVRRLNQENSVDPWPPYFWKVSRYTSHFYRDILAKVCPPPDRK